MLCISITYRPPLHSAHVQRKWINPFQVQQSGMLRLHKSAATFLARNATRLAGGAKQLMSFS